jgi:membrane-associated phospholipid phosphatase
MRLTSSFRHGALAILAIPALLAAPRTSAAQEPPSTPWLTGKDIAWLGASTAISIGVMQVDSRIQRSFQEPSIQRSRALKGVYDGFNLINEKSLFAAGVLTYAGARIAHAQSTADIAWHTTEAVLISGAVGTVARGILGRSRPFVTADSDAFDYKHGKGFSELKYRSFPSLHSSAAFATVAVIATEMDIRGARHQKVVVPLLYTLAAGPGIARVYGDKHWASAVIMGAALGVVAGVRTVRYAHAHPRNRLDRWMLGHASAASDAEGPLIAIHWQF